MKLTYPTILFSLTLFIGGCSSYKPLVNDPAYSTIHIAPIINNTSATQVVVNLQREIRSRFLERGFVISENPDPTLEIVIKNFSRETISRDSSDSGKPLSFRLHLTASIRWVSANQPSPWGSEYRFIAVEKSVFVTPSLIDSEYQVTPSMVEELADKIAESIQYPW